MTSGRERKPKAVLPLMLTGERIHAMVVGCGPVGSRKVGELLAAGARVTVVDPAPVPLSFATQVVHVAQEFSRELLTADVMLVVAATNCRETNAIIGALALELGLLVNVVDAPQEGNVFFPASLRTDDFVVAVSSGGRSPRHSQWARDRIASVLRARKGELLVIGCDHETAPISIRERLTIRPQRREETLRRLAEVDGVAEVAVLTTCNRVEIYIHTSAEVATANLVACVTDAAWDDIHSYLVVRRGGDCAEHLFRVAAGLKSLSLGETQILGQVRASVAEARELGTAKRHLCGLFDHALACGRRVRHKTRLNVGAYSIGRVAVELARQRFTDLEGRSVLLLGAGKMSELSARHLAGEGAFPILVANRTLRRAQELATRLAGEAIPFEELRERLLDVDIVLSSTSAPHWVLRADDIKAAMCARNGRPLLLVDIAVPRDIDPAVADIPGVTLCDVDGLREIADAHAEQRRGEIPAAEVLIAGECEKWCLREAGWRIGSSLRTARSRIAKIVEQELRDRPEGLPSHECAAFAESLAKKILDAPSTRAKEMIGLAGRDECAEMIDELMLPPQTSRRRRRYDPNSPSRNPR